MPIKTIQYACEFCMTRYPTEDLAAQCERRPRAEFKFNDGEQVFVLQYGEAGFIEHRAYSGKSDTSVPVHTPMYKVRLSNGQIATVKEQDVKG
jgi:hypothetical protein